MWKTILALIGARRVYRLRQLSRRARKWLGRRAIGVTRLGAWGKMLAIAGAVILVLIFRMIPLVYQKVVVMPFNAYGELQGTGFGEAIAASLTTELNNIRDTYSPEQERRVAERVTNAPLFSRIVVIPPVRPFSVQPLAISLQPIRLGPVSIPLDRAVFSIIPKFRVAVVSGSAERYGDKLRLIARTDGRAPLVVEGISGGDTFKSIGDLAHKIVADNWAPGGSRHWESLKAFTDGLRAYQEYLVSGEVHQLGPAEAHYRRAIALDRTWEAARVNLATVLYTEFKPASMVEAVRVFGEVARTSSGNVMARTGELNATMQILQRFYTNCDQVREHLSRFIELFKWANEQTVGSIGNASALERYNVHVAKGNGAFIIGSLLHGHECSGVAKSKLQGFQAEAMLLQAEAEYLAGIRLQEGRSVAANNLARLHSRLASYYISRSPQLVRERLEKAVTAKEALKGDVSLRYVRGDLAEDYRRLAVLDERRRQELITRTVRELETMTMLYPDETEGVWAYLRWADTLFSIGEWREGMEKLVRGMSGVRRLSSNGATGELAGGWRHGMFIIKRREIERTIATLKQVVSPDWDEKNIVALSLLGEAYGKKGNLVEGLARVRMARATIGLSEFWYSSEVRTKIDLSELKVLAWNGRKKEAYAKLERAIDDAERYRGEIFLWDLAEIYSALGNRSEAKKRCERLANVNLQAIREIRAVREEVDMVAGVC